MTTAPSPPAPAVDWGLILIGASIGAILSAALALIAVSVFQDHVDRVVYGLKARLFGAHIGPFRLDGIWHSSYEYSHSHAPTKILIDEHYFMLRERRQLVCGSSLSRPGSSSMSLNLRLEGGVLTGTWREGTPGQRLYHGAAQFDIIQTGDMLRGAWIGYSASGAIQLGQWILKREEQRSTKALKKKYSEPAI